MTRHLPPIRFKRKRDEGRSTQVVLIVLVCLIILFLALNFVWAQQIESIGREIQEQTEDLDAEKRQRNALLVEISETGSQRNLAMAAWKLGYRPQTPLYLPLGQPLIDPAGNSLTPGDLTVVGAGAEAVPDPMTGSLWDLMMQPFVADAP
jgi:hypothetical protein